MPDRDYPDPKEEDIVYDDRRISRPDSSLPDWYASDAAYRPIPIVWFAGALILQIIAMPAVFLISAVALGLSPLVTVGLACWSVVLSGTSRWSVGCGKVRPPGGSPPA